MGDKNGIESRLLVFPDDFRNFETHLSVLSPLGAALVGLGVGSRMPFVDLDGELRLVTVEAIGADNFTGRKEIEVTICTIPPARRLAGTGMLVSLLTANKKALPVFDIQSLGRQLQQTCKSNGLGMKTIYMTGFPSLDPQFDRFLYAPLCKHDEMTVSVLSALTRQNTDPWQLAARLTQLPKTQRVKMLASIVEESGSRRW